MLRLTVPRRYQNDVYFYTKLSLAWVVWHTLVVWSKVTSGTSEGIFVSLMSSCLFVLLGLILFAHAVFRISELRNWKGLILFGINSVVFLVLYGISLLIHSIPDYVCVSETVPAFPSSFTVYKNCFKRLPYDL